MMAMLRDSLTNRNHASMRNFAHHILELNSGVVDAKLIVQAGLNVAQNPLADRWWNVGNRNVAGECAGFGADAPHVQVVNIIYTVNLADRRFNTLELHAARRAF